MGVLFVSSLSMVFKLYCSICVVLVIIFFNFYNILINTLIRSRYFWRMKDILVSARARLDFVDLCNNKYFPLCNTDFELQ